MKQTKIEFKLQKVGNLPTGARFLFGGHSTLMIATKWYRGHKKTDDRLCVSESGLVENIPYDTFVVVASGQEFNLMTRGLNRQVKELVVLAFMDSSCYQQYMVEIEKQRKEKLDEPKKS